MGGDSVTICVFLPEGIEADLCAEIAARQAKGIQKYGTTVADNPLALREWLQHALEEALDQAVYLKRAIAELDKLASHELDDMCKAGRMVRGDD